MTTRSRRGFELPLTLITISVMAVVIVAALLALNAISAQHESDCRAMGGHLVRHHAYKSITYICLSPDQRVLRIW